MPPKNDKNQNKTSMVKAMGPFRDSRASSWLPGPRTDVPTEPPSHRPCDYCVQFILQCSFVLFV